MDTDIRNTIRSQTPLELQTFEEKRFAAFCEREMSLAQADGPDLGGAGAGGQGGPVGGMPRPALAAVAHRKKRRAESELLLYGEQMCRFNVKPVECGG